MQHVTCGDSRIKCTISPTALTIHGSSANQTALSFLELSVMQSCNTLKYSDGTHQPKQFQRSSRGLPGGRFSCDGICLTTAGELGRSEINFYINTSSVVWKCELIIPFMSQTVTTKLPATQCRAL